MNKLVAAAIVVVAGAAHAGDKADALFKKGKKQLAEKRYADACATFEQVDELDAGIGAKLNVARCYEEWGKLARAHRWYSDALRMATETSDKRAPKIKELIDKLDPDVPRLTVNVPAGADLEAASISVDGQRLAASAVGAEARVDPGPHEIVYSVDGTKKTQTVALERGGSRELTLPLGAKVAKPVRQPDGAKPVKKPEKRERVAAPESPSPPGRGRRIAGLAIAGAGVAGVVVSGVLTLGARSTYRDALDAHCMGMTNMCDAEGLEITHDARGRANVATVIAVVGGAAIAGGLVLYLTAPSGARRDESQALYLAPSGSGLVLGGRF